MPLVAGSPSLGTPTRERAGAVWPAGWLGSGGVPGEAAESSAAALSPILRNGISCAGTKAPRRGLKRSDVNVWAAARDGSRMASHRHPEAARDRPAQLIGPRAGLAVTILKPQPIHILRRHIPARRGRLAEGVVNGVKTIMVNDPLRGPAASPPAEARVKICQAAR